MKRPGLKKKKNESGFTLIELLIYMSLVSVTLLVLMNFVTDVTKSAAKTKITREIQQNARLVLSRITQDVRTAQTIPTFSNGNTAITFTNSAGQTELICLEAGEVRYIVGGGTCATAQSLTTNKVNVTQLDFSNSANAVTINLTVGKNNQLDTINPLTLSSTVVPRRQLY